MTMCLADEPGVRSLIELSVREDLGSGDRSTALLPNAEEPAIFRLIIKQPGVFAGREIADGILAAYNPALRIEWLDHGVDGTSIVEVPTDLATVHGPLGAILSAERVLLNFLQRLCGIATLTRRYVDAVDDTAAKILDTRKTTPGWRLLEKYAVRCGGGQNHRMGLYDGVLIKDNHLAGIGPDRLPGAVFEMLNQLAAEGERPALVEVEADTLVQVNALLSVVGIDVILLDNFTPAQQEEAVALRDGLGLGGRVALEASGGITLETVRAVAETGVERISVGALTHSAVALDLSMERVE